MALVNALTTNIKLRIEQQLLTQNYYKITTNRNSIMRVIAINQNGMKKEDRASISVSNDTKKRIMEHLAVLIGEHGRMFSQDEIIRLALDALDEKHKKLT